jgi:hypothetical protein
LSSVPWAIIGAGGISFIYDASVLDRKDEYCNRFILDRADRSPISDAVLPKFAEFRTFESRTDAARILFAFYPVVEELQYPYRHCRSTFFNSFRARSLSLTFQAIFLHDLVQAVRWRTAADLLQFLLSEIEGLQVFEVLDDSLPCVERLSPSSSLSEDIEPLFDVFRKPQCQQGPPQLYMYSALMGYPQAVRPNGFR